MANRTMPLRNAQSANRKTAPKSANGRHVNGPRVNGKALQGKPKIPGAQFIAREQILPFDKMVFGLVDPHAAASASSGSTNTWTATPGSSSPGSAARAG
jgi:hypothetical protein